MAKKLNSSQIARLAGVSRATVSRVINSYDNVPEVTRNKVMAVIEQYGYYPSFSGQVLAGKKTRTLGLFWISKSHISEDFQASSFLIHVVESAAAKGYLVLANILPDLESRANRDMVRGAYLQGRIDAGVFIGVDKDDPFIASLVADGLIVGLFDNENGPEEPQNRLCVGFEKETGAKMAKYVLGLGHRDIGWLSGIPSRLSSLCREEAFLGALKAAGVTPRRDCLLPCGITEDEGYAAVKAFLDADHALPTVFCCNNDSAALGAYRALQEAGVAIPDRVSVVGIDGNVKGAIAVPSLTTFAFDFSLLFSSLVDRVIDCVEGRETEAMAYIPSSLIERMSCRAVAASE